MFETCPTTLDLERAAARAWPAARTVDVAGWSVRLSGGGSRRTNSVLPLTFDGDFETALARVEALYAAQRTRSYVQVVSIARPGDLDARLAAHGYRLEEPCLLLAKPLGPPGDPTPGVDITGDPTPAWLSVYGETIDAGRRAAVPAVLATVPRPRAFVLVSDGVTPLASALGVLSPDGIVIVECVATLASARRSGAAMRAMDALEHWAASAGGTTLALQVVETNLPARALYAKRGYAERGRYHYRTKDVV
jgi:GNAT superfamily N-acetyltransferase